MVELTFRQGNYLGGPNLITGVLKSIEIFLAVERRGGRRFQTQERLLWCYWLQGSMSQGVWVALETQSNPWPKASKEIGTRVLSAWN